MNIRLEMTAWCISCVQFLIENEYILMVQRILIREKKTRMNRRKKILSCQIMTKNS